jgi:O-antigen/teichoic acid export membrane protein
LWILLYKMMLQINIKYIPNLLREFKLIGFRKNTFQRNVFAIFSGTSIAQCISLVIAPVLSRIYSPADYGIFAIFSAIVSIIAVVAAGKYEPAIMLPENDDDAVNIVGLSVIVVLIVTVLSFVGVSIFHIIFSLFLKKQKLLWIFFIPPTVLMVSVYQILGYWTNRKKRYNHLSVSRICVSLVTSAGSIGMGWLCFGSIGLILGYLIGHCVATFLLFLLNIKKDYRQIKYFSKNKMARMVIIYKDFPLFLLPTSLLDVFSNQLPIFIFNNLFSASIVGLYSFSNKVLNAPMSLIGGAIGQVFFQRFSEFIKNLHYAKALLVKTWILLFIIGFIPLAIIFLFGETIFRFVFGEKWSQAGNIASILAPMWFINFVVSPTTSAYLTLRKQKIILVFGVSAIIYRPLAIWIGYLMNDFRTGIQIFSILESVQIIIVLLVLWHCMSDIYNNKSTEI